MDNIVSINIVTIYFNSSRYTIRIWTRDKAYGSLWYQQIYCILNYPHNIACLQAYQYTITTHINCFWFGELKFHLFSNFICFLCYCQRSFKLMAFTCHVCFVFSSEQPKKIAGTQWRRTHVDKLAYVDHNDRGLWMCYIALRFKPILGWV